MHRPFAPDKGESVNTNRIVPVGRLMEALWDGDPSPIAKAQIQNCVSALRRQLANTEASSAIKTHPVGYLIELPDESLDLLRFEALAAGGTAAAAGARPADAVRQLRAALALWRGPAVAGINSLVVQVAATRLNEARLTVLEDCVELELELGRHHEVVAKLQGLVAEHPWRERLRG